MSDLGKNLIEFYKEYLNLKKENSELKEQLKNQSTNKALENELMELKDHISNSVFEIASHSGFQSVKNNSGNFFKDTVSTMVENIIELRKENAKFQNQSGTGSAAEISTNYFKLIQTINEQGKRIDNETGHYVEANCDSTWCDEVKKMGDLIINLDSVAKNLKSSEKLDELNSVIDDVVKKIEDETPFAIYDYSRSDFKAEIKEIGRLLIRLYEKTKKN